MASLSFSRLLSALAVVAISCSPFHPPNREALPWERLSVPSEPLPVPKDAYGQIAWSSPARLVVAYRPHPAAIGSTVEIWSLRVDGKNLSPLSLDAPSQCRLTNYLDPTRTMTGSVAFVRQCIVDKRNPLEDVFELMSFQAEESQEPELITELGFNPIQFSWHPALERGFAARGDDTCATLVEIASRTLSYPTIRVADDEGGFVIDSSLVESAAQTCTDKPRASWPALSPDGDSVAFFASPASIGVEGQARLGKPWNLYTMTTEGRRPHKRIDDVVSPRSLTWSPDGRWLAFSGFLSRQEGTWLYAPVANQLVMISQEAMEWLAWSPDGGKLAAVSPPSQWPPQSQIVLYNVAGIPSE